jgi:hypothetical protein
MAGRGAFFVYARALAGTDAAYRPFVPALAPQSVAFVTGCALLAAVAGVAAHHARGPAVPVLTTPARSPGRGIDRPLLRVPHARASIVLDGDTDDPGWTTPPGPARSGPFLLANDAPARPYSDARLIWGDGHLYVALYAADEDIRSRFDQADAPVWLDDSFRLLFMRDGIEYAIEVSANGVVTDAARARGQAFDYAWNSGAHVSHERDGTLNDPTDTDEEWVIEMAIPFESFGMRGERGERMGFAARRCDTPKNEARVCASWGRDEAPGELILD